MSTRREHDLLGDRDVPAGAYYGVHTLRAVENFPITGTPISIYPDLIAALASINVRSCSWVWLNKSRPVLTLDWSAGISLRASQLPLA